MPLLATRVLGLSNQLIRGQRRNLSLALLGFRLQQEGTKTRGTLDHSLSVCGGGGGRAVSLNEVRVGAGKIQQKGGLGGLPTPLATLSV